MAILEYTDLRPALPTLLCPTLLLMGQRDQLVPAAAGIAACEQLPDGRVQVFPRAGHAPFFSHLPAFVDALRSFLDG